MSNLEAEACLTSDRNEISSHWVEERLRIGCNCSDLMKLNLGMAHVVCAPFPVDHDPIVQILYIVLFTCLISLSCAGNLAVIWIVIRHKRMRTVTNFYLLNLAVSDVAITVLNTGFSGTYNLYYNWIFSEAHCVFNNLMGITPICASVFTMIVMSIDRYFAIVHPLKRRPGRKKTFTIIATIWILAFLCGIPAVLMSVVEVYYFVNPETIYLVKEDRLCLADVLPDGDSRSSMLFKLYNNSLVCLQYVFPLLILCFTYGKVAYVLHDRKTIGDTRHNEHIKAKKKAANMLALVVLTFIFMWLPYNMYFLILQPYIQFYLSFHASLYLYINIYCLGMSSCLLNPVIYYFMNEKFRVGFRYAFRFLPWVHVRRSDYESVFYSNSRLSAAPHTHFSNINSVHSGSNNKNTSTQLRNNS